MDLDRKPVLLRLVGIWKRFPGVDALKDVSFEVTGGEVHALVGENGAGKSTLMGVASGSIIPDSGRIEVGGETVEDLSPILTRRLGVGMVHQEPAVLPDLTVLENMFLGVPEHLSRDGSGRRWAKNQLELVGCDVDLDTRMESVGVSRRQLIELAKALALEPRVLILDEPTAPLAPDMVERLFVFIQAAAERGTAVVYISHRLPEVREVADRVTVMRDGEVRRTSKIDEISDDEILELIVGRAVSTAFPSKRASIIDGGPLVVEALSGPAFHEVSLEAAPGEIVGLAGIVGNGQSEFLRALAGLEHASGRARLGDRTLRLGRPQAARDAGVMYLSADRHNEGLLKRLSVRENAGLAALPEFAYRGVVRKRIEIAQVDHKRNELDIRTPSLETDVAALSGGNQQKVVLARLLLAGASLALVDEPTQGVDAGARIEIYRIIREMANTGIPVLIVSSDGLELEGLCDRVVIFSRGQIVGEVSGEDVTERNIAEAIVTATTHRRSEQDEDDGRTIANAGRAGRRLRHFVRGDSLPSLVLLLVILALGTYTWSVNERVLSEYNIRTALTLLSALALISMGQLAVIFTGGIDISVGPLAGLLVVVASFFVLDGNSALVIIAGFGVMLIVALMVGLMNGAMVRFARFTPVAATLAMFIALQGVSLLLRPIRGGSINNAVAEAIETTVGPIPVAFLGVVALVLILEYCLRYTRWGLSLRATGSLEKAAHQLGVPVGRTIIGAYLVCSILVFLGAIMLTAQIRIGDPVAGIEFTLASIAAVVLGGASLFGGRGSVIGTFLGAVLIQQILNATVFLRLSQAWQFWFLGLLTLIAAGIYSQARRADARV